MTKVLQELGEGLEAEADTGDTQNHHPHRKSPLHFPLLYDQLPLYVFFFFLIKIVFLFFF